MADLRTTPQLAATLMSERRGGAMVRFLACR